MRILNFTIIIESVSTRNDIFVKFDKSKGIQDQKTLSNFIKLGHVPSTTLRGWIRHAMEILLIKNGLSICHPLPKNTITAERNKKMYAKDIELGYHPKGSCIKNGGCIIYRLFGDLNVPSNIIIPPVFFYPAKNSIFKNIDKIFGIGTGRMEITRSSPRIRSNSHGMYMTTESTTGVYVEAPFKIILRDGAEEFEPIIIKTMEYLFSEVMNWNYDHLLGGFRSFGHGRAVVIKLNENGNFLTKNRNCIGLNKEKSQKIDEMFEIIMENEKKKFLCEEK
ncbi:MAG: hypothetical protein ACTSPY_18420 [Candidatus Helarchaeota archaeon]